MNGVEYFARIKVPFRLTIGFPLVKRDEDSRFEIVEDEGYVELWADPDSLRDVFSIEITDKEALRKLVERAVEDNYDEISAFLYRNNVQDHISIIEVKEWLTEALLGFFDNTSLLTARSLEKSKKHYLSKIEVDIQKHIENELYRSVYSERYAQEYFFSSLKEIVDEEESNGNEYLVEDVDNLINRLSEAIEEVTEDWYGIEVGELKIDSEELKELAKVASEGITNSIATIDDSHVYYGSIDRIFTIGAVDFGLGEEGTEEEKFESVFSFHKNLKTMKLPNGGVAEAKGYALSVIRKGGSLGIVVGLEFPVLTKDGKEVPGGWTIAVGDTQINATNPISGFGFLFEVFNAEEIEYIERELDYEYPQEVKAYGEPRFMVGAESMYDCEDCFDDGNIEIHQKVSLEYYVGFLKRGLTFFYSRNKVSQYEKVGTEKTLERAWGKTSFVVFEDHGEDEDVKRRYKSTFKDSTKTPESMALSKAFPLKPIDLALRTVFDKKPNEKEELEAKSSFYEVYRVDVGSYSVEVYTFIGNPVYLGKEWEFSYSTDVPEREEFIEKSTDYLLNRLLKSELGRYEEVFNDLVIMKNPLEREFHYIEAMLGDLCFKSSEEGEKVNIITGGEEVEELVKEMEKRMWKRMGTPSGRFNISGKSGGISLEVTGKVLGDISYRGGRAVVFEIDLDREG